LRLAIGGPPEVMRRSLQGPEVPSLLASYYYLSLWLGVQPGSIYRDWAMDSGAFSAHFSQVKIDLRAYCEVVLELLVRDPKLVDVFALDVIGDHKASRRNAEAMRERGLPAIPCFHVGEPRKVLEEYCRGPWHKIALGGSVGVKNKLEWYRECFRVAWPRRIHGFGIAGERELMALPWDSVDATNWQLGPTKFGTWVGYGPQGRAQRKKLSVRGQSHNLTPEVEAFMLLERRMRMRHAKRYLELEAMR
jgi:hypothetical protein